MPEKNSNGMNKLTRFYRELRRRQVFAVVGLYAVAAWAVIEVGDMAIDSGIVSGLTTGNLFTLALIGFPLVLIAGWFYNVTRQGVFRTAPGGVDESFDTRLQIKDYLFLLVLATIWSGAFLYAYTPRPVEKSIAVMPFENRGNDPENAQFAFGVHDDLMTQLQRIGDLKLIAPPSVRAIDPDMPVSDAALKLGVAYIMKGSVERVLDRIRVSVVLLDAAQERQTWAGSFDRELSAINVFDIRDEITRAITGELRSVLSPEERSRVFDLPTTSLEATSHYARGRQLLTNRQSDEVLQALEEFEAAVEIDPGFALAWAGLADAALLATDVGAIGYQESVDIRRRAVNRAMELNDQLGEVWVAFADWNVLSGAPREDYIAAYEKAIELAPNYALAYHRYSAVWPDDVDSPKRLALYQKAMQLDPMTLLYQRNAAVVLSLLGRETEALQLATRLLESNPDWHSAYDLMSVLHMDNGRIIEAIEWLKKGLQVEPANAPMLNALATYYLDLRAWDHVAEVRRQMTERLDPGDWRVPWLDFKTLVRQADWQGAIDFVNGLPASYIDTPFIQYQMGLVHYRMGDMQQARDYWEKVRLEGWIGWQKASQGNCAYAQVVMETDDEALGRVLVGEALEYEEVTLPSVIPHADRDAGTGVCYLLEGKPDKALDFYQRRIEHGHVHDWWEIRLNPLLDPLRDDPQFVAMDETVEAVIAEQREQLFEMEQSDSVVQLTE